MEKLFDSNLSEDLTQQKQFFLQSIIEEAPEKSVDALCLKLLYRETTASKQKVILDCLKVIGNPAVHDKLRLFMTGGFAQDEKIADRAEDLFFALGGQQSGDLPEQSRQSTSVSFRNPQEQNAKYILIPGGCYIYSATQKKETVKDLFVAKYPVTNKLYRSFIYSLQANDSHKLVSTFSMRLDLIAKNNCWGVGFRDYLKKSNNDLATLLRSKYDDELKFRGDYQPVVGVTWYAAQAYCLWLSILEGGVARYRLPNEVEWEWAAGGKQGTTGQEVRLFPWPRTNVPTPEDANFGRNIDTTRVVGSYPDGVTPETILYDMAGNVWEWSNDLYDNDNRALRGGSWYYCANDQRCISRGSYPPDSGNDDVGFRVTCSNNPLS